MATVSMGQYLFRRIKELGTEHILGVPGDFNRKYQSHDHITSGPSMPDLLGLTINPGIHQSLFSTRSIKYLA